MRDAHGDLIPPGTFLYIAERLGLIQEIDRWVVARAIDMLAEQRAAGRDLRFEVNLSGHTIGDPELLELIERRLHETGVPRRPADLRDHRDGRRRQHRPRRHVRQSPLRARLRVRARRLRRRVRLVLLPQAPPVRLPQDRRRVRPPLRHQRDRPDPDLRRRADRPRHGQTHDRRVRRQSGKRRRPHPPRRRLRPGLLPRTPGTTRRTPRARAAHHPHRRFELRTERRSSQHTPRSDTRANPTRTTSIDLSWTRRRPPLRPHGV